jgi:mannose-1-phosphate guanylyltransferase
MTKLVYSPLSESSNTHSNYYVAIMAGGIGSRFWPMSRSSYPKQFLDILHTGRTLIQSTYDRFRQFIPEENIYVVTAAEYTEIVKEQLPLVLPISHTSFIRLIRTHC